MRQPRAQRWIQRLVRAYPRDWRARYGDEFEQLLADQWADGGWRARWWVNVTWHAMRARLAAAGLTAEFDADETGRATRRLSAAIAACLLGGAAMWSQLAVGWQWAPPSSAGTRMGVVLVSAGLAGLAAVAVALAAARLLATIRALRRGAAVPWTALALVVLCATLLILGAGRLGLTWPGTGGHAWGARWLVPAWLARRAWALTLWISSFWAHPRQLVVLGALHTGWMVLTPILMGTLAWAWRRAVAPARSEPPSRRLALAAALSAPACMLLVVAGAAAWALGATEPGPYSLFAPGAIDLGLIAISAGAAIGSVRLAGRVRLASGSAPRR
jgi:hypothetical protein